MKPSNFCSVLLLTLSLGVVPLLVSCGEGEERTADNDESASAMDLDSGPDGTSQDPSTDPAATVVVDRASVLSSLAHHVFKPSIHAFVVAARTLDDAVGAWAATPTTENLGVAQGAWKNAMTAWQYLEVMQVGPAGNPQYRLGGENIREHIYSFPITNPCRVDQQLVSLSFEEEGWGESALMNVQGLDALEFLLFRRDLHNVCPVQARINREGTWSSLMANMVELEDRRGAFAAVLSNRVEVWANTLAERWSPEGDNFVAALATGSAPFESSREALDQIFAGLFYLDKFIKDLKLGRPTGITPDCDDEVCPEYVETPFAHFGKESLLANLEAVRLIFSGADQEGALGFRDLLVLEGAEDLAEGMVTKIHLALEAVGAIDGDLSTALTSDPEQLRAVHGAVRAITDDLKSQMVTVLSLRVPQEGAGDND